MAAGGVDVLHLDAVDLDAPRVGRLVEDGTHLRVDGVAGNERRVKVELADDVADRGGGEVLDRDNGVFHAVAKELRVEDL